MKIPYGISDFELLRSNQYLFVDKTEYLKVLESFSERYIFFLRPRRFGKSLLISMMDHYYDRNKAENFEKLFKGLTIYENPTPLRNSYYILRFNFSGINTQTQDLLIEGFGHEVKMAIQDFINRYGLESEIQQDATGMPSDRLRSFLTQVRYRLAGKIYVLIDEYDHFANDLLSLKTDLFEDTISKAGFVRKFYEVLKGGTESIIDRIFATGVIHV